MCGTSLLDACSSLATPIDLDGVPHGKLVLLGPLIAQDASCFVAGTLVLTADGEPAADRIVAAGATRWSAAGGG